MGRKSRWVLTILIALAILVTGGYLIANAVAASRLEEVVAEIRADGAPLTLAEIAPPPIPDEINAAVVLKRAFAAFVDLGDDDHEALETFSEDPLTAPDEVVVVMEDWVKCNAEALRWMDEALERPDCRFEIDYSSVLSLEYPHILPMLNLCRLAMVDGQLALRGEQPADAFAGIHRLLGLGRCFESETTLLSLLWRMSQEECALRLLALTIEQVDPDEATCVAMREALGRIDVHAAAARCARTERAFTFTAFQEVRRDVGRWEEEMTFGDGADGWFPLAWIPDCILELDQAYAIRMLSRQVTLAGRPYFEVREEWEALRRDISSAPWYALLSEMTLPVHVTIRHRFDTHRARVDLADLALAVRLHEIRHGSLPGTLDAIEDDILPDMPMDPFNGAPYAYVPAKDGSFVLRGVGPNARDDGGEDDDVVWPLTGEE